jgi:hypothetical protein
MILRGRRRRRRRRWSCFRECLPNHCRVLAAIEHSPHINNVVMNSVIDGVRKPLRQESMIIPDFAVDASVEGQGIDIRKQSINEVAAQAFSLSLVKSAPCGQVRHGRRQDPNCHSNRARNCFFAVSQSTNVSWPEATRSSVSFNASACQAGDSNACSSRLRSSQRASSAMSFSARDICFSGSVITVRNVRSNAITATEKSQAARCDCALQRLLLNHVDGQDQSDHRELVSQTAGSTCRLASGFVATTRSARWERRQHRGSDTASRATRLGRSGSNLVGTILEFYSGTLIQRYSGRDAAHRCSRQRLGVRRSCAALPSRDTDQRSTTIRMSP